jgi:hypothetical protein
LGRGKEVFDKEMFGIWKIHQFLVISTCVVCPHAGWMTANFDSRCNANMLGEKGKQLNRANRHHMHRTTSSVVHTDASSECHIRHGLARGGAAGR